MSRSNNIRVLLLSDIAREIHNELQWKIQRGHLPSNIELIVASRQDAVANDSFDEKSIEVVCGDPKSLVSLFVPSTDTTSTATNLHKFTSLRWIQSTWAGVDAMFKTNAIKNAILGMGKEGRQIHFTRMGGEFFGPQIAEYCFCHILAHRGRLKALFRAQQNRQWCSDTVVKANTTRDHLHRTTRTTQAPHLMMLEGYTLGIMGGSGGIGRHLSAVAKRCFGMTVWVYRKSSAATTTTTTATNGNSNNNDNNNNNNNDHDVDRTFSFGQLPEFLSGVDYFVNCLPCTPETHHLLSGDVLSNCRKKKTSTSDNNDSNEEREVLFINVGRGNIIDEASIVRAIENKWISGAVLDVFEQEPVPATSPLWSLPNVTITPHHAGISTPFDVASVFADNLKIYAEHRDKEQQQQQQQHQGHADVMPLQYKVDWEKGY